jgi:nitrate/nitrite transporter NarK
MVMQLPSGRVSDRYGARRACAAGLAVLAVCNAVALVAPDPALALGARLAMGVGTALAFIGGSDYVRASGGSPFAQGLYGGLATAGGGVALVVVPMLEGPLAWRAPYLSAIAIAALAAVLLAAGPGVRPVHRGAGAHVALRTLIEDGRMLRLAVVFAGSFGLSVVIGNWVVTLLEDTTSLGPTGAGAIAGVTLILGVVSRPLGGWILRAHPERARQAILASAAVGALGALALASGSVALALVGACAVGLAAGIPFAAAFTGAALLHPRSPATAIGLVNAAGALTVVVGAPLAGVAFEHDSGVAAFVVIAALWAASAVPAGRAVSG